MAFLTSALYTVLPQLPWWLILQLVASAAGMTAVLLLLVGALAGLLAMSVWLLVMVTRRLRQLEAATGGGRRAQMVTQAGVPKPVAAQVSHLAPLLREQIARRQAEAAATKAGKPSAPSVPPSHPDGPEAA